MSDDRGTKTQEVKEPIAKVIRAVMETQGWSGAQVAREAGVAPSTITRALDPETEFVPSSRTVAKVMGLAHRLRLRSTGKIYAIRDQLAHSFETTGVIIKLGEIKPGHWIDDRFAFPPTPEIVLKDPRIQSSALSIYTIEAEGIDRDFPKGTMLIVEPVEESALLEGDIVVLRQRIDSLVTAAFELSLWDVVPPLDNFSLSARAIGAQGGPLPDISGPLKSESAQIVGVVVATYRRLPRQKPERAGPTEDRA